MKQTAAKVKEVQKPSLKTKEKDKEKEDKEALSKHEQQGKHSEEEAARGTKRILGKKQMH